LVLMSLFMRLTSKKYKIASWKKNDFEDLDDFLVSLPCTICYDKYLWYLMVKKGLCSQRVVGIVF
jgi:hypothetical protein